MYIITRQDLSPGYQATQSCHALRQFIDEHSEIDKQWFERSNYLAVLSVRNEQELLDLIDKASRKDLKYSIFFEPDLKYEITAIALEPGKESKKLCGKLKLALKDLECR